MHQRTVCSSKALAGRLPMWASLIKVCHLPQCFICHSHGFERRGHGLRLLQSTVKQMHQNKNQDTNLFLYVWPRLDSCATRVNKGSRTAIIRELSCTYDWKKDEVVITAEHTYSRHTLSPSRDSHKGRNVTFQYLSPVLEFSFHSSPFSRRTPVNHTVLL